MNYSDNQLLTFFLERMNMFIYPINRDTITAFIHGFEIGGRTRLFTQELKEYIEEQYQVYGSNQGWPRQVELLANQWELSWENSFIKIAQVILENRKTEN